LNDDPQLCDGETVLSAPVRRDDDDVMLTFLRAAST
jgi:hypothetical protein